jgi:hypothetical protein
MPPRSKTRNENRGYERDVAGLFYSRMLKYYAAVNSLRMVKLEREELAREREDKKYLLNMVGLVEKKEWLIILLRRKRPWTLVPFFDDVRP